MEIARRMDDGETYY